VKPTEDLTAAALEAVMPGRAVRAYPAMLSTEADALAWGRAGGPAGAVVVADYQASPRGRAGWEWQVSPGTGLGFSVLVRPPLPVHREGWPYLAASVALADVVGGAPALHWPDEVHHSGGRAAAVGVHAELGEAHVTWMTVTVLIEDADPPRADLLARAVAAIEYRLDDAVDTVLDDYRSRCATFGQQVIARLIPMGPSGVRVEGEAVDCRDDGSLVIRTADGRRVAVPPQHLGILETEG
jgi:BirA family transcriptional regulator, biotin operon repressor / biotin---[acetyl-CoA-carboxylase] ligase